MKKCKRNHPFSAWVKDITLFDGLLGDRGYLYGEDLKKRIISLIGCGAYLVDKKSFMNEAFLATKGHMEDIQDDETLLDIFYVEAENFDDYKEKLEDSIFLYAIGKIARSIKEK